MSALQKINFCPVTPECTKRLLYIDVPLEDVTPENVFSIDTSRELVAHVCRFNRRIGKPEIAYLSEWLNSRTKRTRYMGPFRTRSQAEKSPKDDKLDPKRRGTTHEEWSMTEIYTTKLVWKKAPPK